MINKQRNFTILHTLFLNTILAGLYIAFAQLGSLLIIPPADATLFWPAAGIAFAFVYLYGFAILPGLLAGVLAYQYLIFSLNEPPWTFSQHLI